MHCLLQIVTKGQPSAEEIEAIMTPYYECDFYDRYWDPVKEEHRPIPEDEYPAFHWDYYTIWEQCPSAEATIGDCFAMIDRQGRPHVRKWWNGKVFVDKTQDFDYWIKRIIRERGPQDWVTLVDYHY